MRVLIAYVLGILSAIKNQPKTAPPHNESKNQDTNTSHNPIIVTCMLPSISDEEKAAKSEEGTRNRRKFRLEKAGFIVLLFYTFFTGMMYLANKKAADAATESAKAARDAVKLADDTRKANEREVQLEQRAWITFEQWRIVPVNQTLSVILEYSNAGKTPAFNVWIYQNLKVLPVGKTPNFNDTPQQRQGIITAGPKRELAWINYPISQDIADIAAHKKEMFIYGTIWYNDAFTPERHWIQYCAMLPDFSIKNQPFRTCPSHNSTDYEQSTKK